MAECYGSLGKVLHREESGSRTLGNPWIQEERKKCQGQSGIKIAGRNTNNFRYADDTTLMAESEEELKSLLMKVKEESEKAGLKT